MEENFCGSLACDIPVDVMLEIISRVPVKSLLKFKCVSEAWYSIVNNRFFIKKHFGYFSKILSDGFTVLGQDNEFKIGLLHPGSDIWEPLGICGQNNLAYVGEVNGLICLTPKYGLKHGSEFLVINPALRDSIITYNKLVFANKPKNYKIISLGFGFDLEHDEFKIVRIEYFNEDLGVVRCPEISVYSLYADSWKKIKSLENISLMNHYAVQSGNFLCWRSTLSEEIVAFRLNSERFYDIPLPGKCARLESRHDILYAAVCESIAYNVYDWDDISAWTTSLSEKPENLNLCKVPWEKLRKMIKQETLAKIQMYKGISANALRVGFPQYQHVIKIISLKESLAPVKRGDKFLSTVIPRSRFTFSTSIIEKVNDVEEIVDKTESLAPVKRGDKFLSTVIPRSRFTFSTSIIEKVNDVEEIVDKTESLAPVKRGDKFLSTVIPRSRFTFSTSIIEKVNDVEEIVDKTESLAPVKRGDKFLSTVIPRSRFTFSTSIIEKVNDVEEIVDKTESLASVKRGDKFLSTVIPRSRFTFSTSIIEKVNDVEEIVDKTESLAPVKRGDKFLSTVIPRLRFTFSTSIIEKVNDVEEIVDKTESLASVKRGDKFLSTVIPRLRFTFATSIIEKVNDVEEIVDKTVCE